MTNSSYLNSPEFKRGSTNAANSILKVFFKWLGIAISAAANFVKTMLGQIVGK